MKGTVTAVIRRTDTRNGGYGFIRDINGHDRFFHARDLVDVRFDDLKEQDAVEFEPQDHVGGGRGNGNGRRAEKVSRA